MHYSIGNPTITQQHIVMKFYGGIQDGKKEQVISSN